MSRRAAAAGLLVLALATGATFARSAAAQSANDAMAFEDLGFVQPPAWGARDAALETSATSGADVSAILANCAGLTRLKRINAAAMFDRETSRIDLTYADTTPGNDIAATRLAFAGVACPFPVLRGSLVPAFAIYRAFSSDLDLRYARDNTRDGRSENFAMDQDGATYAYALAVAGDLSPVLSAGVSLYLLHGNADTHRRYAWQPLVTTPTEETFVLEDIASTLNGYGAQVGVQLFAHRHLQIGMRLDTPIVVNVSSSRVREETRQIDNDIGTFSRETDDRDTRYLLPYRFAGAVAAPLGAFTLSLQAEYADWGLATIERHRVYTTSLDLVLDRVVTVTAGAEWSVPGLPLRVRAGYGHAPSPFKYLQADRLDNDEMVQVDSQTAGTTISAGAAVLLFERVVVEGAWLRTSGSRETPVFGDETSETRLSLQGTYWF